MGTGDIDLRWLTYPQLSLQPVLELKLDLLGSRQATRLGWLLGLASHLLSRPVKLSVLNISGHF